MTTTSSPRSSAKALTPPAAPAAPVKAPARTPNKPPVKASVNAPVKAPSKRAVKTAPQARPAAPLTTKTTPATKTATKPAAPPLRKTSDAGPAKTAVKPGAKPAAKPVDKAAKKVALTKKQAHADKRANLAPAAPKNGKGKTTPKRAERIKMVRDSFTFPEAEHKQLVALKKRLIALGVEVKKGELVRAGIGILFGMDNARLTAAMAGIEKLKTGRPKK
ncbi:MAG TPA: hypothetical protein VIN35_06730 [Hydrogenophaga sp.]